MYCTDPTLIVRTLRRFRLARLAITRIILAELAAIVLANIVRLVSNDTFESLTSNVLFLFVVFMLGVAFFGAFFLLWWLKWFATCPRCYSRFHGPGLSLLQSTCNNCGLRDDGENLSRLLTGRSSGRLAGAAQIKRCASRKV
jgi:hypothetical protein